MAATELKPNMLVNYGYTLCHVIEHGVSVFGGYTYCGMYSSAYFPDDGRSLQCIECAARMLQGASDVAKT